MISYKGFKTKEEAEAFSKKHGGWVVMDEWTPKRKHRTRRGHAYMEAVVFDGLDRKEYPYCVQWDYKGGK